MDLKRTFFRLLAWVACGLALAGLALSAGAAPLPADWQHEQRFQVPAPGLVKMSLPVETLDAARRGLEDLRLYDDAGNEVPYLIQRPVPVGKVVRNAASFDVALNVAKTVLTLETGLAQPLDGVTLETPARDFIKAVRVEGSADRSGWQALAQGLPVFRQAGGASQLHLAVPPGTWRWLRLTVDDRRSAPIPFTGAHVHAAVKEPVPTEAVSVTIASRLENPGESRLTLNLGFANLDLTSLRFESDNPLFTREIRVAVPEISAEAIHEQTVAQGTIYRVAVDGQPPSSELTLPVEHRIASRELVLLVNNQDSPPLAIAAVQAERRPVYLVFLARSEGPYHLLTGNARCAAPRYDLAALSANLKTAPVSLVSVSPPAENPAYRAPEVLAGIQDGGTALDVSDWRFRKPVKLARAGAQQLELDLDVLAHAQPDFGDLRLLRSGKQLPYVLQCTSISRSLAPGVTVSSDPKDPKLSRWRLKLSHPALPLTRLTCITRTALFQRDLTLYEEVTDERGEKFRRTLGEATWVQTPERASKQFILGLQRPPQGDTLVIETHNGDNPAIELDKFQLAYPATRVLFKAQPEGDLFLFYGNPQAASPRYDLSLVAGQLLAATRAEATLSGEEQLKKGPWFEGRAAGKGGIIFWGMLALVVVVLLVIISRLLPKPER